MSRTHTQVQARELSRLDPGSFVVTATSSTVLTQNSTTEELDDIPIVAAENVTEAIPNGGYGWVIVFAAALHTFWTNGFIGAWGVIQAALLQARSHETGSSASTSTLSFVGSLSLALMVACGLMSARLGRAIGARYCFVVGSVLYSSGLFLAGFTVDHLGGMFVTAGMLTGLGCSLFYTMANSVPVQWFGTRLGMANGLIKLGGGIGSTVLSVAAQGLTEKVGINWMFRILGGLALVTGLPAALLIRERRPPGNGPFVDFSLFRNLSFVSLFLAGAIGTFALFVPPFFLPLFAHSIGLSSSTGAGITAAFNACTAVGRFGSGFACDRLGPMNVLLLSMLLNALTMLAIWPVSSTIGPLTAFAALNGIANGAYFVAMPTSLATLMGPGYASVAMSMGTTGWTGGYLMGSPIAGILIATTGADKSSSIKPYRAAILYAGGVALAAGAFVLIARLKKDANLRKIL